MLCWRRWMLCWRQRVLCWRRQVRSWAGRGRAGVGVCSAALGRTLGGRGRGGRGSGRRESGGRGCRWADRDQETQRLGVAGIGLQDRAEVRDRLIAVSDLEQQASQVHAERKIVWKRRYGIPEARDHGMLVIHAAPGVFVCLARSRRFYASLTAREQRITIPIVSALSGPGRTWLRRETMTLWWGQIPRINRDHD